MNVRTNLGEQTPVNIRPLVALGVGESRLVDFPQEHLGEALIQQFQCLVQTAGDGRRRRFGLQHGSRRQNPKPPAPPFLIAVRVFVYIAVVNIGGNIGKEFTADGVRGLIKNHQVHCHVM